uniref:Coiled-coil domain-containing protein 61 n=1 Tax=Schistocephalus solidus TaxID=70667 RepID=A0A0X3PZQ3_SCHSO
MVDQSSPTYFYLTADFSGQEHIISFINTRQQYLKVEVRNVSTLEEWHASFTANYIEDMTKRTGNFKNFKVFTSMLYNVAKKTSSSLTIDLVSYEDLEALRQTATKDEARSISSKKPVDKQRRYLILTYISDFDRTFYPLPLVFVGVPDRRKLIAQVHQLREELYNRREPSSQDEGSHSQNEQLENRIKTVEKERDSAVRKVSQLRSFLQAISSGEGGHADNELEDEFSPRHPTSRKQMNGQKQVAIAKHDLGVADNEKLLAMQVEKLTRELAKYRGISTPNASTDRAKMSSMKSNWVPSRTGNNSDTKFPYQEQTRIDPEAALLLGVSPNRRITSMRPGLPTSALVRSHKETHELATQRSVNPARSRARSADSIPRFTLPNGTFDPTAYILHRDRKREAIAQRRCIERLTNMSNSRVISPHSLSRSRSASDHNFQERCARWDHCLSPSCVLPRRRTPFNGLPQRALVGGRSTSSPSPVASRGSSALREAGLSRHLTESLRPTHRRWRSPRSRQLLSAAGALSDSESEAGQIRRSSVHRRTDSSSTGASICTDAGDNCRHSRSRSLHRSRSCGRSRKNGNRNIQDSHSCSQNGSRNRPLQMDVELSDMDRRLNVLQNFFDNYFVAGV